MGTKWNRPAKYAGAQELAEQYLERFAAGNDDVRLEFAHWLADEGRLGAYPLGLELEMTVGQLVDRFVATPLGQAALKDWALEWAEADLEP